MLQLRGREIAPVALLGIYKVLKESKYPECCRASDSRRPLVAHLLSPPLVENLCTSLKSAPEEWARDWPNWASRCVRMMSGIVTGPKTATVEGQADE